MKKLLLLNNLLLFMSIGACPWNRPSGGVEATPAKDSQTLDSASLDTLVTGMITDSIAQTGGRVDSLSKDEKYKQGSGSPKEAPKHNAPDQAKIDSIKAAKAKKKKD